MEGEIGGGQSRVCDSGFAGELISEAMVGAGMEVAGGTGRAAVAADLHVPEESFAEQDEGAGIEDVLVEIGWTGDGDGLE